MYLKTYNEKGVNTWISSEKDEDGNFINHTTLGSGSYYEEHNYCIVRLGSFEPGTDIEVRLTIRLNTTNPDTDEYTIIKDFFFYQFDYDMFKEDIDKLKENQWNITEYNDRYVEGTITAEADQLMLTTIPTEKGWTVKVDGKKVDTVEVLNAFIGIELEPGEHTVTMKYTPPGFVVGMCCVVVGIGLVVLLYLYDRKHNKVLLARIRAKKRAAEGLPPEETEEKSAKKKPVIIKSETVIDTSDDNSEEKEVIEQTENKETEKKPETKPTENKSGNNNGNKKKKKK
jgi:hypothetical protein